ncbi:MAG: hypothetical protein AAF334_08675, partial [Pseudomonadota bacterium]
LLNTVNVDNDVPGGNRSEHEIALNYGALSFRRTGLAFQLTNARGQNLKLVGIEWSNTLALYGGETSFEPTAFSLALYTGLRTNVNDGDDLLLTVGPAMKYAFGSGEVAANTFLEVPFNNGRGSAALDYALGMKYDLDSTFAVGVAAHGEVPSIFKGAPDVDDQEHYAGTTLDMVFTPEGSREVGVQFGAFYGLTEATPTVGLSANLAFGF